MLSSAPARVLLVPPAGGVDSQVLSIAAALSVRFEVKIGIYPAESNTIPGDKPVYTLADALVETARSWLGREQPSVLFGYSYGGRIAVELANRLAADGIPLDLVVIGDVARELRPNSLSNDQKLRREGRYLALWVRWIFRWAKHQLAENRAMRGLVPSPVLRRLNRMLSGRSALVERLRQAVEFVLLERQLLTWQPARYPGSVLLALTKPTIEANQDLASDLGWSACCPRLLTREFPGDHHSFAKFPHVEHLIDVIHDCLRPK